jgi:uncharacterized protein
MNIMAKPIGPACNIDCDYCYYLSKQGLLEYDKGYKPKMEFDQLEHYIKSYIEQQNFPQIVFHWQGGEPTLLGVKYFREVIRLQKNIVPMALQLRITCKLTERLSMTSGLVF